MNSVIEAILTRRSIRSFQNQPIKRSELDQILKAAVYAPSGMGRQTWQFTAVTNPVKLEQLANLIGKELERENYGFYHAQALIIPSNQKDSPFGKEDNACALENIFLAAHSLGIGSVWINQLQKINDNPSIRQFLTQLDIPQDHAVYGIAALGYAAEPAKTEVHKTGIIKIIE